MKTLMSEQLAPITSHIGFLRLPLEAVGAGLTRWHKELYGKVKCSRVSGDLPSVLRKLEPLTGSAIPRVLLVSTVSPEWTAYFNCDVQGTDPVGPVGHLSRTLRCSGVNVCVVPPTKRTPLEVPGRYGAVQFELLGPFPTYFMNYVRTISLTHNGHRWRFDANGQVQDFERPDVYEARRVRDRFSVALLEEYCQKLGLRPLEESYYGRDALLIEHSVKLPRDAMVLTLEEAQGRLGIRPGIADQIAG